MYKTHEFEVMDVAQVELLDRDYASGLYRHTRMTRFVHGTHNRVHSYEVEHSRFLGSVPVNPWEHLKEWLSNHTPLQLSVKTRDIKAEYTVRIAESDQDWLSMPTDSVAKKLEGMYEKIQMLGE